MNEDFFFFLSRLEKLFHILPEGKYRQDKKSDRSVLGHQSSSERQLGLSFCFTLYLLICLCDHASGEEVSGVPGQSSSVSSETGAAHPDGPTSQPHSLHRSQVTNSNSLLLCDTDVFA